MTVVSGHQREIGDTRIICLINQDKFWTNQSNPLAFTERLSKEAGKIGQPQQSSRPIQPNPLALPYHLKSGQLFDL